VVADHASFEMTVRRLGHEPRPTVPFSEEKWLELVAAGKRTDTALAELGLELTVGGEPTFTSRIHTEKPEWNTAALGETKWTARPRARRGASYPARPGRVGPA